MRQPRTSSSKHLLNQQRMHDISCFSWQGMECGRCSLPERLRDIECEAMAPLIEFVVRVEGQTKPSSVYMSGDTGGHPASGPRSKDLWQRANTLLNDLTEDSGSTTCMCGLGVLEHRKEVIRFCHFGYHTVECTQGGSHV